ncbi:MAG TPA: PadR family transcriptional regulator [Firmicutes bacterium]|nr:PadR family transcriptional regulator [Bacillota bacterium]
MCGRHHYSLHPLRPPGECGCHAPGPGGRREGFIQPCLLLLLVEKPAHGYELMDRLGDFGLAEADPGGIYRNLKRLEEEGYIESTWETGGPGPARKEYRVTPEGEDLLHAWASGLAQQKRNLEHFLTRYQKHFTAKGGEA